MVDFHETVIIVSSDTDAGATNKSADGSTFSINLDEPLVIPTDAQGVDVFVQESTVWWTIYNIQAGVNDTFYIEEGAGPGGNFWAPVVPPGLYDLSGLQTSLERELVALGAPAGLFNFIPDEPTQKVVLRLNQAGSQVNFNPGDTFRDILGFDAQFVPVGLTGGVFTQLADNVAAFNTLDYFLIHSDLVTRGIRINNSFSQTIAQVLITASPGSQIISSPRHPPHSPAPELVGTRRSNIRMWLTDQANNLVDTAGENWSARIVIRYAHPMGLRKNV